MNIKNVYQICCEHAHHLLFPLFFSCFCPLPSSGPIFNLEIPHTRRTVWSCCIVCVTNRHTCTRRHRNFHPHAPMFPTDTFYHMCTPCYSDFSRSPQPAGNSSQLSRCCSSLTLWLSKHQGWTWLFLFFLCFLLTDVDNHPLGRLSQEGSFFLPFHGTCTFLSLQALFQIVPKSKQF